MASGLEAPALEAKLEEGATTPMDELAMGALAWMLDDDGSFDTDVLAVALGDTGDAGIEDVAIGTLSCTLDVGATTLGDELTTGTLRDELATGALDCRLGSGANDDDTNGTKEELTTATLLRTPGADDGDERGVAGNEELAPGTLNCMLELTPMRDVRLSGVGKLDADETGAAPSLLLTRGP